MPAIIHSGMPFAKVLYLGMAALAGILAVVLVTLHTGCSIDDCIGASLEAYRIWYWLVAIPGLCIVSASLGYVSPRKAWIWGLAPLLAQWLWEVLGSTTVGTGNLGPFAHVVVLAAYALSAIPGVIVAEVAAHLSRRKGTAV